MRDYLWMIGALLVIVLAILQITHVLEFNGLLLTAVTFAGIFIYRLQLQKR